MWHSRMKGPTLSVFQTTPYSCMIFNDNVGPFDHFEKSHIDKVGGTFHSGMPHILFQNYKKYKYDVYLFII